jgi:hypothetical protein
MGQGTPPGLRVNKGCGVAQQVIRLWRGRDHVLGIDVER